jgi:hypothetical protein
MNAAAWAYIALICIIGSVFVLGWRWRLGRDRSIANSRQTLFRCVLGVCVIAAAVLVPVVAQPGNQPGWTALVNVLTFPALFTAIIDIRSGRSQ